jgi:hypothetical protein
MSMPRRAARLAAAVPLGLLYVLGAAAAVVVVVGVSCGVAVRLGWSDVRKRAAHGAA